MKNFRKQKKDEKKSKYKEPGKSKVEYREEEEVYREINSRSFGDNFTILIQHYKRQIEINPPKIKIP